MAKRNDPKDLLLGLYGEFNKPCGDYRLVTAQLLEMEEDVWLWSLMWLKTEGLVDGVKWIPPGAASAAEVMALHAEQLHLTREGAERARELTGADGRSRPGALRKLLEIFMAEGLTPMAETLRAAL